MENATLKRLVGQTLAVHGFERKSGDWYLQSDELTVVLNLQKNDFRNAWHLNLGVWISDLGVNNWPKSHVCPIQVRVQRLWPSKAHYISDIFDMERDPPDGITRSEAISSFLEHDFVPLCKRLIRKDSLQEIVRSEEELDFRVMLAAREWLGLPPPT